MLLGHFQYLVLTADTPATGTPVANKVVGTHKLRVDFSSEIASAGGLVLCPDDIDPSNFIIDSDGTVFAIDFGRTGYMPPSYVSYSLKMANLKPFTRLVASLVDYPESAYLLGMYKAAAQFVTLGNSSGKWSPSILSRCGAALIANVIR